MLFGIGGANAACWLTGFGLGWLLDSHLGTTPLFVIVGLFVGVALGVVSTYKEVRRYLGSDRGGSGTSAGPSGGGAAGRPDR